MDPFVEVYTANNVPDAYVIKAALEGAGITVQITNEYLEGALIPLDQAAPRVLVPQSQADAAREVLREMASQPDNEGEWEEEPGDNRSESPLAMRAPDGQVVTITRDLVRQAVEASRKSDRKRIILPFHKSDASPLHRMLNAVQPGSYIRPHWHRDPPKDESLVLLQGEICVFVFEDDGRVRQAVRLRARSNEFGIDLSAGVCHTFVAIEPDTVVFEVKPGPYDRATDKDFASWAPVEGTAEAKDYVDRLVAGV